MPVTVIELRGRFDASGKEDFEARVWEAIVKGGVRDILIDLTGVSYLSSAGLRALNSIHKLLHPNREPHASSAVTKSPHFKLVGAAPPVKQIIVMAGLDSFFEMYDTQEQALAAF